METLGEENGKLQKSLEQSAENFQKMQKDFSLKVEQITESSQKLAAQNSDLIESNGQLFKKISEFENLLQESNQKIKECDLELKQEQQKSLGKCQENQELADQLEEKENDRKTLQRKCEQTQETCNFLKTQIESQEEEILDLKGKNTENKKIAENKIGTLTKKVSDLEAKLQEQGTQFYDSQKDFSQQISELGQSNRQLKDQIQNLLEEVNSKETQIQTIPNLQRQNQELLHKIKDLEKKNNSEQSIHMQQLTSDNRCLAKALDQVQQTLNAETRQNQNIISTLTGEIDLLKSQIAQGKKSGELLERSSEKDILKQLLQGNKLILQNLGRLQMESVKPLHPQCFHVKGGITGVLMRRIDHLFELLIGVWTLVGNEKSLNADLTFQMKTRLQRVLALSEDRYGWNR